MEAPAPRVDELLRAAIEQKRLIRFLIEASCESLSRMIMAFTTVPSNFSDIRSPV